MAFLVAACHNLQTANVAVAAAVAAVAAAAAAVAVAIAVAVLDAVAAVALASACFLRNVAATPACGMVFAFQNLQTGAVAAAAALPSSRSVCRVAACPFGPLGWGSWWAPRSLGCRTCSFGAWRCFDAHSIASRNCSCCGLGQRHGSSNNNCPRRF